MNVSHRTVNSKATFVVFFKWNLHAQTCSRVSHCLVDSVFSYDELNVCIFRFKVKEDAYIKIGPPNIQSSYQALPIFGLKASQFTAFLCSHVKGI